VGERTVTDIILMDLRLPGTSGADESDLIRLGKDPLAKGAASRITPRSYQESVSMIASTFSSRTKWLLEPCLRSASGG